MNRLSLVMLLAAGIAAPGFALTPDQVGVYSGTLNLSAYDVDQQKPVKEKLGVLVNIAPSGSGPTATMEIIGPAGPLFSGSGLVGNFHGMFLQNDSAGAGTVSVHYRRDNTAIKGNVTHGSRTGSALIVREGKLALKKL